MTAPLRAFEADFLYSGGMLRRNAPLTVDAAGLVAGVGRIPGEAERVVLPRSVILPGLVNAHSHAFQRTIRGRTEHRVKGRESDDFWTWREQMYGAALSLTPEELFAASRMAFLEMLLSGITTVGEFHYLHRDADGVAYSDQNLLAKHVIGAAGSLGLRIALLRVAYLRAGHDLPVNPRQARFLEPIDDYARNLEQLAAETRGRERVTVGVAPHSVRAVSPDDLDVLGGVALAHRMPFHLHAAEQPAEIEACLKETGKRPVQLFEELGLLSPLTTLVHAIHLSAPEIRAIGEAKANVCACPSTERNLGDGIVPADELLDAGAFLSLGTDSQATVDLLEDARELDYHLRLKHLRRAVLGPRGAEDERDLLARRLLTFATTGGARSLGLSTGGLAPGTPADFLVISLDDPSIAGAGEKDLLAAIVFTLARTAIRKVFVQGEELVSEGRHRDQDAVVKDFTALSRRLWGDA